MLEDRARDARSELLEDEVGVDDLRCMCMCFWSRTIRSSHAIAGGLAEVALTPRRTVDSSLVARSSAAAARSSYSL